MRLIVIDLILVSDHSLISVSYHAVFEIYPLPKSKDPAAPPAKADSTTRLSFFVSDLDRLIATLTTADPTGQNRHRPVTLVSLISTTEFGRSAVIRDLDGRSIELVQQPTK